MPFDVRLLQDIANRGRAALDDYRNQQTNRGNAAGQALQSRSQTYQALSGQQPRPQPTTGRGPVYDQLLWARNSTRFPGPGSQPIVYGQIPNAKGKMGDYAGFKNSSDLFNAVEGRAGGIRQEDVDEASALREIASQGYEQASGGYDEALKQMVDATNEARHQDFLSRQSPFAGVSATGATDANLTPATGATDANPEMATPLGRGGPLTYLTQPAVPYETSIPGTRGSRGFTSGDAIGAQGVQGAGQAAEQSATMARRRNEGRNQALDVGLNYGEQGYRQTVNDWLQSQVEPLQQAETYATGLEETPFSQYAQAAGAEYGVDPNIIAGRFGPAEDVRDFSTTRNLSAIENYGIPYDEVVQQLKAADAAQQDQATAADKAGEQQIIDTVSQMTGMDAQQLASTTNMTPMQLANVVADPDYQSVDSVLRQAVANNDDQEFTTTMQEIGRQRPDMYEVLLAQYQDFIPAEYDIYG